MVLNYYNSYEDYDKAYEEVFKGLRRINCIRTALVFFVHIYFIVYI